MAPVVSSIKKSRLWRKLGGTARKRPDRKCKARALKTMRIGKIEFENYRSLTSRVSIDLNNIVILTGKNNEGKTNVIRALQAAVAFFNDPFLYRRLLSNDKGITKQTYIDYLFMENSPLQRRNRGFFSFESDFPKIGNTANEESFFSVTFQLNDEDKNFLKTVYKVTGLSKMKTIIVEFSISRKKFKVSVKDEKNNVISKINELSKLFNFINKEVNFNFIPAIRNEKSINRIVGEYFSAKTRNLQRDDAVKELSKKFQKEIDDSIEDLEKTFNNNAKNFLPTIKSIRIKNDNEFRFNSSYYSPSDFEILINDGVETSIASKGDGVKSAFVMSILQGIGESKNQIIAIDEPESHLHDDAIKNVFEQINNISKDNQVILSTHRPLFMKDIDINDIYIVDKNNVQKANSVKEIRKLLGIDLSNDDMNKIITVLFEGKTDIIIFKKFLSYRKSELLNYENENELEFESLGGIRNLASVLNKYKNDISKIYLIADNDKASTDEIKKSLTNKNINQNAYRQLPKIHKKDQVEIEDFFKDKFVFEVIKDYFVLEVDLKDYTTFEKKNRFQDRIKNFLAAQGKTTGDDDIPKIKETLASKIDFSNSDYFYVEIVKVFEEVESRILNVLKN